MGTGASQSSRPNSPESSVLKKTKITGTNGTKPVGTAQPMDPNQRTLVRTNQVAPIIIRNCKEEYQHVTSFKGPMVYGRIAENMPEHVLLQNQYFMVKDVHESVDKLGTLSKYMAPNMRQAWGGFPVYGMGQPTRDGLSSLVQLLCDQEYEDILLFNMRAEPVLFVRQGHDMIPYSPHHQDRLHECASLNLQDPRDLSEAEVLLRKEVLDHALLRDDHSFFFYNDITTLKEDPHMFNVAYEDDLAITDEIYGRLSFDNSGIKYTRLMVPSVGAPLEKDIDTFLDVFRNTTSYFDRQSKFVPAMVFTAHSGLSRTTLGMVLGCLILAHKQGFPKEASKQPFPINKKSPNYERGEFVAIQQLVSLLPNGLQIKQEVDVIIDLCDELHNIRNIADQSRRCLESITSDYLIEGISARNYLAKQCTKHVERYAYLILLNAYLRMQYSYMFSLSFTRWMQQRPEIYQIIRQIDISERRTLPSLLTEGHRLLVADDYLGLDVLSSQMDVKTSNFRRVPGTCVYGMAQPSREGLSTVVSHLLASRQGHPMVVMINLRGDEVLECDGSTYSWREIKHLDTPIMMHCITAAEIEEKEEQLKKGVKAKKICKVYQDIDQQPEVREFNSVLTEVDMCNQLRHQIPQIVYHRVPIIPERAPTEEGFDKLMKIITSLGEVHTDEDGPAILFHCRTGKDRTTTAMAITCLILCHQKGFPYGTKPGEEERVSLPNADYTKGNFQVVHRIIRRIPNGQQVKREVDFILDQCSDTMTPMHYHIREVIFVTYNKSKKAKTSEEREAFRMKSLDYLERYIYLILFNTYLHCERRNKWKMTFTHWMKKVASTVGIYDILDNLSFPELDPTSSMTWSRRQRWNYSNSRLPYRGVFI